MQRTPRSFIKHVKERKKHSVLFIKNVKERENVSFFWKEGKRMQVCCVVLKRTFAQPCMTPHLYFDKGRSAGCSYWWRNCSHLEHWELDTTHKTAPSFLCIQVRKLCYKKDRQRTPTYVKKVNSFKSENCLVLYDTSNVSLHKAGYFNLRYWKHVCFSPANTQRNN